MAEQPEPDRPPLSGMAKILRLAAIGSVVFGLAAAFAFAGGWLTPRKVTPSAIVDALERAAGGPNAGFRRNHAKGVAFRGHFEANGQGVRLSRAAVFAPGRTPVVGRFALAGSRPFVDDDLPTVRSLAVEFDLPNGEVWRMAINGMPVFPVRTPEGFYDLTVAGRPDPRTGKPDPSLMAAFREKYPESAAALKQIGGRPISTGFDNETYRSLNAFRFVASDGTVTPVRWAMEPVQPFVPAPAAKPDKNGLFDALVAAVRARPPQWRLIITIGQPGDATDDPSVAWPADRERVDVGTLTVERIEAEDASPVRDINFDPLVLPDGIRGSDDPILSTRSAAYSVSHRRRESEPKRPGAVNPTEVRP